MNKTPNITIDISANVTLPSILKQMRNQWSFDEIIEGVLDFCCDLTDEKFEFETKLIAALQKFKEDNA